MLKGGSPNKYSIDVYWNKLQQDDKMFFLLMKNKITLKVHPDVLEKYAASKIKEYDNENAKCQANTTSHAISRKKSTKHLYSCISFNNVAMISFLFFSCISFVLLVKFSFFIFFVSILFILFYLLSGS